MAKRDSVYRPNDAESAVVIGSSIYDVPLLPYERQLIATIGITEEEYRAFTAEVRRRGAVRPAEYDHIPDVQAGATGTAILINLAISLVLTGVSYLLTPKPKMPRAQGGGVTDLGSITGANRFTPSRGFETLAELADYASPVPIIFGMYKNDIGGMLVTPKLIWSRMFSHGTSQRAKLMFVVGEQGVVGKQGPHDIIGIDKPDLEGIFLGNNALDAIFKDRFAFYWHKDSSTNFRIKGVDKQYGSRGSLDSGDPEISKKNDVFDVVDLGRDPEQLFCHAYTPANSTTFGCHSTIANGTNFRVNYQLNLIPKDASKDSERVTLMQRMKVVGESGALKDNKQLRDVGETPGTINSGRRDAIIDQRHDGTGRNYSPRMGVVEYDGIENNDDANNPQLFKDKKIKTTIDNVTQGKRIKFVIKNNKIASDFYEREGGEGKAPVDDINSTVESLQLEADGAMQLGEHFMIGGSIWKVVDRKLQRFEPSDTPSGASDQQITLECVDTSTSKFKKIGIVSKRLVVNPNGLANQFIGDSGVGDLTQSVGAAFYPITQVAIATIKNNRPALITEIGLKSKVFQRLNGLCNFQNLPSKGEVKQAEKDNTQINNGTISATIRRSSMFRIFVRKAGESGPFEPFNMIFVIQGQTPSAQYNYIKFINDKERQLEFKFVPFAADEFRSLPNESSSDRFVVLDQAVSSNASNIVAIEKGTKFNIKVVVSGKKHKDKKRFQGNDEFKRAPRQAPPVEDFTYPDEFAFDTALPTAETGKIAEIGSQLIRPKSNRNLTNDDRLKARLAAFFHDIAGPAAGSGTKTGSYKIVRTLEFIDGSRAKWLHLEWKIRKTDSSDAVKDLSGQSKVWTFSDVRIDGDNNSGKSTCTVLGSGGNFSKNEPIEIKRGSEATNLTEAQAAYDPNSNPFIEQDPLPQMEFSGMRFLINNITKNVQFEGISQSWRHEVFGLAADANIKKDESKTVTTTFTKDNKQLKVKLKATKVKFNTPVVGQDFGWSTPEIGKVFENETTSGAWAVEETFSNPITINKSNPFFTRYNAVDQRFKILNVKKEDVSPGFSNSELDFETTSQVSDISSYRNFVEKSNSTSPEHEIVYVNEVQINDSKANMSNLTLAGLSLRAGRNFTALDQMRVWLKNGMAVERLHPTVKLPGSFYGDTAKFGPSNLLTDLMYFMFTDQTAGAGGLLGMDGERNYMIEKQDLVQTSKFLVKNNLFFNGPIVERTNLRQFFSDIAPSFLCNFLIVNGKFSLKPALPVRDDGTIEIGSIKPGDGIKTEGFFTAGNILEDSYKIEYLGAEERRAFKAVVRYRQERANQLPEEAVVEVKGVDSEGTYSSPGTDLLPQEEFDLTQFCTSRDHAILVAKYFLSLRAYVTHTINFSTTAEGLNIGAGSFIKVTTEATPYNSANTGTVDATGVITSVRDMPDNLQGYDITYFRSGDGDVETGKLIVSNGKVADSTYHNILFTVTASEVSQNIYVVEQLTFSQDGIVDIVASEYPCDSGGQSKIALAVVRSSGWSVES
jgi:hypothetical protein